jgi:hypothetical protein
LGGDVQACVVVVRHIDFVGSVSDVEVVLLADVPKVVSALLLGVFVVKVSFF